MKKQWPRLLLIKPKLATSNPISIDLNSKTPSKLNAMLFIKSINESKDFTYFDKIK